MSKKTVLLADDEHTLRKNLAQVLSEEGFKVVACKNGTEALAALKTHAVDIMITDLRMPGITGMELIDHAEELAPDAIVIVITAFGEVETAVAAMKKGAKDYICKPLNFDELIFRLKRLIANDTLVKEHKVLREQVRKSHCETVIADEFSSFRAILNGMKRISETRSNVLICGESGTGKEVLARAIHYNGPLADKPFVAVNCGALPDTLVESELFGYKRGAFTGANADRVGYFEAARGGTLFLDEIGNLPIQAQPALLRAIEERAITRIGDSRARDVDFRLIAATNRDLEEAIKKETFRDDLYYRLNVLRINIPPLRERPEDIPLLADHFVAKYNAELNRTCPGLAPDAIDALSCQPWRGNVRELENVIERALIFSDDGPIRACDLTGISGASADYLTNFATSKRDLRSATRDFERRYILGMLAAVEQNKVAATEVLGIGLSSLYRKMEELGIAKIRNGSEDDSGEAPVDEPPAKSKHKPPAVDPPTRDCQLT